MFSILVLMFSQRTNVRSRLSKHIFENYTEPTGLNIFGSKFFRNDYCPMPRRTIRLRQEVAIIFTFYSMM